jgi:hypothetical protein
MGRMWQVSEEKEIESHERERETCNEKDMQ